MLNFLLGSTLILSLLSLASIYRAFQGPTPADRIIAINLMTTLVIAIILIVIIIIAIIIILMLIIIILTIITSAWPSS